MARAYCLCTPFLFACAATAQAADNRVSLTTERADYSNDFGKRRIITAESTTDTGSTAFTVTVSHGKRTFEEESFSAVRVSGTVFHDWSDRLYTRTSFGLSSDKPVFATRELSNDVNFKLLPNTVVTVGAKHARYHDNRDAISWSAGGSWYFAGGLVSYRYSSFDVDKLGKSHGHLATVRLKDGKGRGSTQLWLGKGTSLHEQELLLEGRRGTYRSVVLQRVQPAKGPVSFTASLGRTWFDTAVTEYRGTTASVGLSYTGLKLFN